ncbi:MAG: Arm DNA-binding domain-containing protein, partial [Nioella sp.]
MPKTLHRLTAKQVENAAPGTSLADGGGLSLRCTAKGHKRWVLRYSLHKSQREMGLGSFPAVSLAQARHKAASTRERVAEGLDPINEAQREAEAAQEAARAAEASRMTLGRYADEIFLPTVLPTFSNAKHRYQWENTFRRDFAGLRDIPLTNITREDVLKVLRPIWTEKITTASRGRERLERL